MIEKILQNLGLTDKEIKVYLSSLKLGPTPVRKIALEAGINRGTTYDILKALIELGLVSYYHQAKKQYFIAEDPAKLKDVLEKKQQDLEKIKGDVDQIIPQLKSIYDNAENKPVVKFYEGDAGVKIILQDVIASCLAAEKKEYYVYSSSTIKKYIYELFPDFTDQRIKANVNVKVISVGPGGEIRGLDERKWLTTKESAPTYTLIYAGKVAMISVDSNDRPIGIIIEDNNLYKTQWILFNFAWQKLE
ncbi:MAG: helix-turn-helix domain-containing protein [Patescibacteria group bacterium]|jgi:sugar-specific transcriptional regulator TrmB